MIKHLLKYHLLVGGLLVALVAIIVCITNYQPGTFLSGWDTLHPEFNLSLYTQRVIFGAWQEHQGLGAPASQAHLAELPRLPLLWLLTAILPLSAVRYSFFFLMYILGGLGAYLFIARGWFESKKAPRFTAAAVIGAWFYLLNIGTLQHFYVPLEMFAVHFATLGFLLYSLHQAIKLPSQKHYFWFLVVQILSAPSAHTATLFYMYMAVIFGYGLLLSLSTHGHHIVKTLKILSILALLTFLAHSYWLVPNLYYVAAHSDYVREAKISRLFSSEAFWQNQAFGSITDVIINKNFLFNWKDYHAQPAGFIDLFDEWLVHLNQHNGYTVLYILAIAAMAAIPLLLVGTKQEKLHQVPLIFLLGVPFFFLVNLNFPFTTIFASLRNSSSLFEESLRFPFTKFSMLWIFSLSVLLSHFLGWCLEYFQTLSAKQKQVFSTVFISFFGLCVLYTGLPAFQGNLISSTMKVEYPDDYQQLFDWSKTQPAQTRIAKFPVTSFWGWNYYDWEPQGYQGAGFTWFGLLQPTMDREFDRWANTNEFFYHELAEAIKTQDQALFNQVLKKYQISWLMYDHSVIDPQRLSQEAYLDQFLSLIAGNSDIKFSTKIGDIDIYEYTPVVETTFITSKEVVPLTTNSNYARRDVAYLQQGDYILSNTGYLDYPFADVVAERVTTAQVSKNAIELSYSVPKSGHLNIPTWLSANQRVPVMLTSMFDPDSEILKLTFSAVPPEIKVNDQVINPNNSNQGFTAEIPIVFSNRFVLEVNGEFILISESITPQDLGVLQLSLTEDTVIKVFPAELSNDGVLLIPDQASASSFISVADLSSILPTYEPHSIDMGDILAIKIKVDGPPLLLSDFNTSVIDNCNRNVGTASVTETNNQYVFLSDHKAIACHRFSFDYLLKELDYLMLLEGRNDLGMTLKFNLNEKDQTQPYLEEMLNQKESKYVFSVLGNREQSGMDLHLSSTSFGDIETKNTLESLAFVPVPLNWMSTFSITTNQQSLIPQLDRLTSHKLNNSMYLVETDSQTGQANLNLEQSYDAGWLAVTTDKLFTLLPHSRLNGWANTWIVPSGQHRVIIFYLPQLATWIGLWSLGTTLIWFGLSLRKKS